MSWFKRDSPFRSSLRGKFNSLVSPSSPPGHPTSSSSSRGPLDGNLLTSPSSSYRTRSRNSTSSAVEEQHDAQACFESFRTHWRQAWDMMRWTGSGGGGMVGLPKAAVADHISGVLNHLDQMLILLLHDLRLTAASSSWPTSESGLAGGATIGPLLDLVLTEDILGRLFSWSLTTGEFVNALKLEQLKLYETLVTQSGHDVLVHKPVLQPMLALLASCADCSSAGELEKRLVILLNQLCVCFTHNVTLLEFFFSAVSCDQGPAKFLIFSLLIPFVHREGSIGQQARDALLLCMALSRRVDSIGMYIAEQSTFCPVLATGLSGLYSLLPRKVAFESEDWHSFTPDDVADLPELAMFLNSLEFCNAVVQVAHPAVQRQLLDFLDQGFLQPVLVPALYPPTQQQASMEEAATATAYLNLFLRSITEPPLLRAFLKMLLLGTVEGQPLIDTLVLRIASQHPLGVVTMSLFHSLLDLSCEDVMLHLVFRYLIPCTHIMVSQRCRVRDVDMFGKSAEKFLSLVPSCCLAPSSSDSGHEDEDDVGHSDERLVGDGKPSPTESRVGSFSSLQPPHRPAAGSIRKRTPSSASSSSSSDAFSSLPNDITVTTSVHPSPSQCFLEYLVDARRAITSCSKACQCWTWPYDGESPPSPSSEGLLSPTGTAWVVNGDFDGRGDKPATNGMGEGPKPLAQHPVFRASGDTFGSPDLGPFLSILLSKLENMLSNSVYENLQLTGVLSRLATYPQPLLRSFLLNHSLVFQPSVRSLLQVLGTVKQKLDAFFYTVDNVEELLARARGFLRCRDERLAMMDNSGSQLTRSSFISPSPSSPSSLASVMTTGRVDSRRNSTPEGTRGNHSETKRLSITDRLFRRSPLSPSVDRGGTRDSPGSGGSDSRMTLTPTHSHNSLLQQHSSGNNRSYHRSSALSASASGLRRSSTLLDAISSETGYRFVKRGPSSSEGKLEFLRTKNAILCAVVLEDFLKELSAIAMEHAVLTNVSDAPLTSPDSPTAFDWDFLWQPPQLFKK